MIVDPWLKLLFLIPIIAMLALFVVYFLWPHPGAELRNLEALGSWEGVEFDVMTDPKGRRFVSVCLWIGGSEPTQAWALMGSREALRLARMLRIAASPGENLAQARYAFMRKRA